MDGGLAYPQSSADWGVTLNDAAAVPPTEVEISLDALTVCARHLAEVSESATTVARATSRTNVSATSFGLMNTALGAAVVPFVRRAQALTGALDHAAAALAGGSRTMVEGWRTVESDAAKASRRLTEALEAPGS